MNTTTRSVQSAVESAAESAVEGTAEGAGAPQAAPAPAGAHGAAGKRWYVVHAYSGMEKSVARALQERIERASLQAHFGRILVPTEEVVEIKGGKRAITERRLYSGYVLVEMEMADEAWHLVKTTPKVTGFLGGTANRPSPLSQREVDEILQRM